MSHSAEDFRSGTLLCFKFSQVLKNLMPKRGIARFSEESLLSHGTEKLRSGNPLCLKNFLVSKVFKDVGGGGGGEGVLRFSVKNLSSHSAESYRRGSF